MLPLLDVLLQREHQGNFYSNSSSILVCFGVDFKLAKFSSKYVHFIHHVVARLRTGRTALVCYTAQHWYFDYLEDFRPHHVYYYVLGFISHAK